MQLIEKNGQKFILQSNGTLKVAIKHHCKQCLETFYRRKQYNVKKEYEYCSVECKINFNNTIVQCSTCEKSFNKLKSRIASTKSQLSFCSRQCKDKAQRRDGIREMHPPHYKYEDTLNYRAWFTTEELFCHRCNYKEFIEGIHIHHMDEDRTNNQKSNLIPLCANCHAGLHKKRWSLSDIVDNPPEIKIKKKNESLDRPTKECLEDMVKQMPVSDIAKKLNVSGRTVHLWIEKYEIEKLPVGYWLKQKHRLV